MPTEGERALLTVDVEIYTIADTLPTVDSALATLVSPIAVRVAQIRHYTAEDAAQCAIDTSSSLKDLLVPTDSMELCILNICNSYYDLCLHPACQPSYKERTSSSFLTGVGSPHVTVSATFVIFVVFKKFIRLCFIIVISSCKFCT